MCPLPPDRMHIQLKNRIFIVFTLKTPKKMNLVQSVQECKNIDGQMYLQLGGWMLLTSLRL